MIDVALFMQARLDSSRLPQKALLSLNGSTSLEMAMQNLLGCANGHFLLSPYDAQMAFEPLALKSGYGFVAGEKDNVLARFVKAIKQVQPKWVIRATADNSLIGPFLPQALLAECIKANANYARFIDTPYGGGVEVIKAETLLQADKQALTPFEREHVCPYVYSNPHLFKVLLVPAPKQWYGPTLRATLDTLDDYIYLQKVYKALYTNKAILLEEFIEWATRPTITHPPR